MNTFSIALLSVVLSVGAQFSLKAGMSGEGVRAILSQPKSFLTIFYVLMDKYIFGGFILYAVGAIVWLGVLSKWDVSQAYPMVGLGMVFSFIIGYMLGEQVTLPRLIGLALICVGVFCISKS